VTAYKVPGVAALVKGKKPGELIARLDFDPYERSLRYVSTHILAHELSEAAVREALRSGHAFVAHDWLCDSTGFAFVAMKRAKSIAVMGDEVQLEGALTLAVGAPLKCEMKLIRNGVAIQRAITNRLNFANKEHGFYRV